MEIGAKCKCGEFVKPGFGGWKFAAWIHVNGERHQGYMKVYFFPNCPKCNQPVFPEKIKQDS